ncbi:MAG: SusC/RagA family protein [Bacteroidetes bacterium GWF2_49_14]|nr:MAG: SusC/RagA family protein [Bacteroidetes bacterium GWF2_49_14]HBB90716.1 SusC/RagA family protein [Bacteroidales bacterium]
MKRDSFSVLGKLFLPVLTLLFIGQMAYAQQSITGMVTDAQSGEALIGASVSLKSDPTKGTITGVDGSFRFSASQGQVLIFSYVGYITQEVTAGLQTTLNVALTPATETISGVVVIGYGTQKKKDATGSVTAISSKDFNRGSIVSPQQLLIGRASGVNITTGGGAPGEGATIRIRGGSSMSASNDPLIVVDGIPLDNEGVAGMRNPLNAINPNDIESFTILKDASATAIYGSRASNGVIIITTKKGAAGSKMKITYDGKASYSMVGKTIDVLNAEEYKAFYQELYAGNETALKVLGTSDTEWQKEILSNSFGHDHSLALTGSAGTMPYRASLGYSDMNGILKTSSMERWTGALSLDPVFLDNHLKVSINAKGMRENNRFASRGAIGSAIGFDPTQPVYTDGGKYGGYFEWLQPNGDPITIATQNPLAQLMMRDDRAAINRLMGNVQVDYKFHFLPELRANLNVATDLSNSQGFISVPDSARQNYDIDGDGNPIGGIDAEYKQQKKNELVDFYLNYVKEFGKSRLDVMGGYSWQHFYRKGNYFEANAARTITNSDTDYESESYLVSFFGRVNYSLMDKYLLTFTLRNDGSSRFSPDNRWGLFPSAAIAWKIKEESFLKDVDAVSDLKLRLGYGVTGQQNITSGDYPYLARYTFSEITAQYQFGNHFVTTLRPEGYDANLKWEETATYNIGLDYGFLKNRILGSVEYYYRETKDLINTIPVPAGTNLTNQILTNVGNLVNKGVEFSILGRIFSTEELFWEVGYNITFNKNEITKLTATDDPNYKGVFVGGIGGGVGNTIQIHSVGSPAYSFYVYEQVFDKDGKPIEGLYVDRNGDGKISADDKYLYHNPAPAAFMGFNSRLNYKNWDFSFAGRVNLGNYVYNNVNSGNGVNAYMYNTAGYATNVVQDALYTGWVNPKYWSDYYVQDASFLRLDNVSLGYQFKNLASKKLDLYLSLSVQNAFVVTKYTGLDPEVYSGIDGNIYPRPRIFMLGLKLDY